MRLDDYLKGEIAEVEHCAARWICPFGEICGTIKSSGGAPLFPTVLDVDKDEMLWTDMRFEQRVFVIKSGLFVCMAQETEEGELPYALYGSGIAIGAIELYTPREISEMYYLRAILPGKVCSLPFDTVKRKLNEAGAESAQEIVTSTLLNQSRAMFSQVKVIARHLLRDKIILQLLIIRDVVARSGKDVRTFKITHEELAYLVGSDRVSVTRVLNAMRDEGLIDLGYISITLNDSLLEMGSMVAEARSDFYVPGKGKIDSFLPGGGS